MSAKSRYIQAAKQTAYHNEIKKALDENTGASLTRMSSPDYLRMLINEGVLSEPPTPPDYSNLTKANAKNFKADSNAWAKWEQSALKKISTFGVTGSSLTPGYDKKRKIFTDAISNGGGGFAGHSGLVVAPKEEGGYLQGAFGAWINPVSNTLSNGDYKSPWTHLGGFDVLDRINKNGQGTEEEYEKKLYQAAYDRQNGVNENVWGSAANYKPIKFWNTTLSQKDARKLPFYKKKNTNNYTFDKWREEHYQREWQSTRHRLGLSSNIVNKTSNWPNSLKNITTKAEVPNISTIQDYLANKDVFDDMNAYAAMMRSNKNFFDIKTGKPKGGANVGFNNFNEWRNLSPDQQRNSDSRIRVYEDYYAAKAFEASKLRSYKSSVKSKANKTLGLSAIATVVTGGLFAASGLSAGISSSLGGALSSGVVTGAAAGAAGGAVTGGFEGALKGALVGGLGAGISETISGTASSGLADSTSLENQFYNSTADQFGNAITPASLTPNLGNNLINGEIIRSGSGLLGQFSDSTNQAFSDAITPDSLSPNLTGNASTGSTSGNDLLADNIGDNVASQIVDSVSGDNNGQSNQNNTAPNSGQASAPSTTSPPIRTGGIFGGKRARGTGFNYASSNQTQAPSYNSGIRLNKVESNGLLQQQQKRI